MRGVTTFAAAALACASTVSASPPYTQKRQSSTTPVTIKGNAFFQGSNRFYIRGVDYQPGGSSVPVDPLANPTTCKRDIQMFQKLGLNTVRIYTVDNTANHDVCMQALADAGMYLALDVNSSKYSINRAQPHQSYNDVYLQNVFATVDAFAKYDNTLLFFSGNEIINTAQSSNCAPYLKAVTRDMKSYIAARKYRQIPVGYSAADVQQNRYQTAAYMNCGADSARSDFFAFNDYSWCDPNSYVGSGWADKVKVYGNYSIPLFLSEYGCNKNPPREFEEVTSLYSSDMSPVYSGGLVFEYSQEATNPNFGLVNIKSTSQVTPTDDFDAFMTKLKGATPPQGDGGYKSDLPPLACPGKDQYWEVGTDEIPTMPAPAQKYLQNGAGAGVGLSGPGSQTAGTPSSSNETPSGSVGSSGSGSGGSQKGAAAAVKAPIFGLVAAGAVALAML